MAVMDEDLQRLWHLLAELSSQLTQNRDQCEQLKKQAEDLKTQAIHTGTGYALRRFNVDLSKEQFESELERMNAQLVVENQTLQHENRQLTILLKDYETTLEQIMTRFRTHAHSTQQHELDLTKYYESILLSLLEKYQRTASGLPPNFSPHEPSSSVSLTDPNVFQAIQNISTLIQRAMRELSGEETSLNELDEFSEEIPVGESSTGLSSHGGLVEASSAEQTGASGVASTVDQPVSPAASLPLHFVNPFNGSESLGAGQRSSLSVTQTSSQPRRSSTSTIEYRPRARDPSRGGFVGTRNSSLSDAALQTAIELERLQKENEHLRELLGIANDINVQSGQPTPSRTSQDAHAAKLNSVVEEVIKEEEEEEEEEDEEDDGEGEGGGVEDTTDSHQWPRSHITSADTSAWSDDDEPVHPTPPRESERVASLEPGPEEPLPELSSLSLSESTTPQVPSKIIDENAKVSEDQRVFPSPNSQIRDINVLNDISPDRLDAPVEDPTTHSSPDASSE
ncbi:hypothetical protein CROQUDRAFT_652153 [Cronartium quercuum f. sp. fusiforme G11]|uniref:Uncharacterized protein n=1 Tax=Cronartium quercuum f. sp. fusiforme G11 TaxID=708437 RepID=A0A9P6TFE6_9BASI|nr:hypothetical protein CROQUDRAFT_652153 [Cronartium quercuum f. sp. fusiforme G11]